MPDSSGATVLDDVPEEVIVGKILILLPPKDIGRCRAVRTSWRSATSTPEFMLQHHRCQPSLPITHSGPTLYAVLRDPAGACDEQLWPFSHQIKFVDDFVLRATCDGFLIVSSEDEFSFEGEFFICNPVIRKRALLPIPRQDTLICGLYHHKLTGEYRVLFFWAWEDTLSVLTVGDNEWRSIEVILPSTKLDRLGLGMLGRRLCCPTFHHHGNLHWDSYWFDDHITGPRRILVFDTEAESFRWMRGPSQVRCFAELFDMNGTLAVCSKPVQQHPTTTFDIWLVQDYEAETWVFKCRIDLSMVEASRPLGSTSLEKEMEAEVGSKENRGTNLVVLNDRELLVNLSETRVLHCDVDNKFLGLVSIRNRHDPKELTPYRLQENIMPIPSRRLREDVQPASSTGHA